MSQNPKSSQSVAGMKMEASPVTQPYTDGGSSRPSSKLRFSSTFLKHLNLRFKSPNSSQSSAGKKLEASPVTQPDGGSCRPSSKLRYLKHVTLSDWWLIRTEEFPGHHNLGVGGIHSDPRSGLQVFKSAAIIKRHRGGDLETSDGITITVVGSINRECTRQNGFSCEVCSHFLIGFPFDWEDYAGADGSISRANDARVVPPPNEGNSQVTSKVSQEDEISIKNNNNVDKQHQIEDTSVEEDAPVVGTPGRPSTKKRKSRVMKEKIQQEESFLLSPIIKSPPLSKSLSSATEVPSKRRKRQDGECANEEDTPNLKQKATKAATGLRKRSTGSRLGNKGTQNEEDKSVSVACKTSTRQLSLRSRSIDVNIVRWPS